MKTIFCLIFGLVTTVCVAQNALLSFEELEKTYNYETYEEAMNDPKNVIRLTLSNQDILSLEYDFRKLVNLQWLDLSKNGLKTFPLVLTTLTNLQYLNLASNEIDKIPDEIGNLVNLKELLVSKNRIYVISPRMGELKKLEKIDMWDNPIKTFPEELRGLSSLKSLDLRVTVINETEKKKLMKMFPDVKIKFSKTCNCE